MTPENPIPLTPREEGFCQRFAVHHVGLKAAEEAGYAGGNSGKTRACKMLKLPRIQARIAELEAQTAAVTEKTVEVIMGDLEDARSKAIAAGQFSAAIRASELQGKQIGMFKDRVELTGKDGGPIQSVTETMTVKEAAAAYADTLNNSRR